MKRVAALLSIFLAASASAARDRQNPASGQDPATVSTDTPGTIDATLLALGQLDQRMTVPVDVGKAGPYNFIIDTGAERTVIARELAGSLRLAAGAPVRMTAMTGTSQVDTVVVPNLAIASIGEQHTIIAPALQAINLGAMGLLGIDTLQKHRITIDFERGTMAVMPSLKRGARERRDPDEIVVTAKNLFGQLIVTDAYYGNTRIQVVLDTGSQVTMGNAALRRRIGKRGPAPKPIVLTSVTGAKATADYTQIPDISVGKVKFGAMPVAFAEVAPFERFGLVKRPALMLGMDALRAFRRVDIDFPNRQVRFLMPESKDWTPRTGSLIRGSAGASPMRTF